MNYQLDVCKHIEIASNNLKFIGLGNIWIKEDFSKLPHKLAQFCLAEALNKTAVGQLEVIAYDGELQGVFAPFSMLSSGELKLVKQLSSEDELYTQLMYLKEHIRSVQNILKGIDSSLISLRERSQETIENFKLCAIYADYSMLQEKTKNLLLQLARVGPAAGVNFIIVSYEPEHMLRFEKFFQFVNADEQFDKLPITKIVSNNNTLLKKLRVTTSKTVSFNELPIIGGEPQKLSSKNGLIFSIGKYGLETEKIVLGDEINQRHNILITGAVGQGKSNLLSVIIHSLCQNYSPQELNLYLLDFKEGVTLQAFSNIDKSDYLPHVMALGLESDTSFGKAVLDFLYSEYKRRLKLFKDNNKKSIKEYREGFPKAKLPRIVVIIDEFQLMFGEKSDEARKIAVLLEKSVRLFRAAGIHFILASQTIGGNEALYGKMEALFSQIPIRIAHKNSLSESQLTLGMGNTAAIYLKPREVILNLDYGELTQNKKIHVAFADESILGPLRIKWWKKYRTTSRPPVIFDGTKPLRFTTSLPALKHNKQRGIDRIALFGQKISVLPQPAFVKFKREIGHHIALLGASEKQYHPALGILQSVAVSLAFLDYQKNAKFLFCNAFEQNSLEWKAVNDLLIQLSQKGIHTENLAKEGLVEFLEYLVEERQQWDERSFNDVYIFGFGMERLRIDGDRYQPPLENFLRESADLGIHFIGWWIKSSTMEKQAGGIEADLFNTKILLRLDDNSIRKYIGISTNWQPESNRALLINETISDTPIPFVPYSSMSSKIIVEELFKGD